MSVQNSMEFCGKHPKFEVGEKVLFISEEYIEGTILDEGILGSKLSSWYFCYLVEFEYKGKKKKEWMIEDNIIKKEDK